MSHDLWGCLPGTKPCKSCRVKRLNQEKAKSDDLEEGPPSFPVEWEGQSCLYDVYGWCARYGHAQQVEPWKCPGRLYTATDPSSE